MSNGELIQTWTYVFVTITFMLYLFIGWRSRVKETQGFYVAGRGVPAIANGAATAADWMSAASFISMAGLISFAGFDGTFYLMGWTGGYVLLALLLAPYLRKFGQYTVPDFIGARYYSETARIVAAVCAIFVSLTYVAGQMRGVGIVFSRFLEVDIWVGVVIGMVIVAFFAVLGGMKGITWTQVAQFFVLILAFLIPSIGIAYNYTSSTDNATQAIPQAAIITSDIAERLNQVHDDLGFDSYTEPFTSTSMLNVICITFALMAGTAGLPHVIVRFYTVPSVRAARYSAGWALLFIAILYTTAPTLAMFARYNILTSLHNAQVTAVDVKVIVGDNTPEKTAISYGELTEAEVTQASAQLTTFRTAQKEHDEKEVARAKEAAENGEHYEENVRTTHYTYTLLDAAGKPIEWPNKWQSTSLVTFNDVNLDGRIQMTAVKKDGKKVFAEAMIDKDTIVLSTPEVAGLPPWVIALVATGGLAAALSTAAGLLLVISSSVAHDLYIHFFDPEASEAKRVKVGRIMIVAAIFVAGYFGVKPPGFVGEVVAFAFGLAASSFFPAIFLGIFDKRTNRAGAISGMIVGILFTGTYIVGCTADNIFGVFGVTESWWGNWCFGIKPTGIGAVGCLINFVVTIAVSRMTDPPPAEVQELVERVRVPKGAVADDYEI